MERKSSKNKKILGNSGETMAAQYLSQHGYKIVDRNFRFANFGEIDIIARENEYICFIEVKTRSGVSFGMPCESVNRKKQDNIKKLAYIYLKSHNLKNENIRFDIVEVLVSGPEPALVTEINLIKNAF